MTLKEALFVLICLIGGTIGLISLIVRVGRIDDAAPAMQRDTVVVRDTIHAPVPEPRVVTVVRRDTVWLAAIADSVARPGDTVRVEVPISQSVYETDDYRATVEGFRARLVDMQIYRPTITITNTVTKTKRSRWALTIGSGIGYGLNGIQPYLGVQAGVVVWGK